MVTVRPGLRGRLAGAAAALLLSLPAAALPPDAAWTLRHPADPVAFHGAGLSGQADGMSVNMMYPAPSLAGLVAAVLTHAALNEGTRNQRTKEAQAEADRVLEPLQDQVQSLSHAELMRLALEAIPGSGATGIGTTAPAASGWQVSSTPVFYLTQDRRALILDNTIGVFPPGESARPSYTTTVRVVSRPHAEEDPLPAWKEQLKPESARLLAHSLVLALRDARRTAAGEAAPYRTLRYFQGPVEKVERAQPVEAWCERVVIRTLRGWLLSAPVRPPADAAPCDPGELVRN